MAKFNLNYYRENLKEKYSDGDIESEMINLLKDGSIDWYSDSRWPIVYHFSHLRQNILNWYPFTKQDDLLEVGSGCGALTSLFCEKCRSVTSVELTERRAHINFDRNKEFDNLEIIVGNFSDIKYEKKFDYIIVNGVLEYAAFMFEDNPYETFLLELKKLLNPNGKILIAIENRLGLKYFSGSKEDHNGIYFSGINSYIGTKDNIRTFSKSELKNIISNCGLKILKFYYPYPDYKFPTEIFTDETINSRFPTTLNIPFDMDRINLFDENETYRSLMSLNIMDNFSNSFLLEVALNKDYQKNITVNTGDYIKLSSNRNEKFRIATILNFSFKSVVKIPLTKQSETHIKNMYRNSFLSEENLNSKLKDTFLEYDFLNIMTLEEILNNQINLNDKVNFWNVLRQLKRYLYTNTDFIVSKWNEEGKKIFGDINCSIPLHWKKYGNVDLIASNIFYSDNSYKVIDYEWIMNFPVPMEYSLWRMIVQYNNDNITKDILDEKDIISYLEIDQETVYKFKMWEKNFINNYVGIKDLSVLSKNIFSLDLNNIENKLRKEQIIPSHLFLDIGNGFNEDDIVVSNLKIENNIYSVMFDIPSKAMDIRWDPIEGQACKIKILDIKSNVKDISLIALNSEETTSKESDVFYTFDPQYQISGDISNIKYIFIQFYLEVLEWYEGYNTRVSELNNLKENYYIAENKNKELLDEIKYLQLDYEKNQEVLSEKIEIELKNNHEKELEIQELKYRIEEMKKYNYEKELEIKSLEDKVNEYEKIKIVKFKNYIRKKWGKNI